MKELLGKNQMEKAKCSRILKVYARERERMETILAHSPVSDELSQVTKEEYDKYPVCFRWQSVLHGKGCCAYL